MILNYLNINRLLLVSYMAILSIGITNLVEAKPQNVTKFTIVNQNINWTHVDASKWSLRIEYLNHQGELITEIIHPKNIPSGTSKSITIFGIQRITEVHLKHVYTTVPCALEAQANFMAKDLHIVLYIEENSQKDKTLVTCSITVPKPAKQ